jgi:tRNA-splicing ligase RtcB
MPGWTGPLSKIGDRRWLIPKSYKKGMRVDGLIFADEQMVEQIRGDQAPEQVANVAFLQGIAGRSMAMPDIHWGYGFPIGGVAATDAKSGVISPGGVGYDINCGVRLLRSDLTPDDIKDRVKTIADAMYQNVPCGIGSKGKLRFSRREIEELLREGSRWALKKGYGWKEDVLHTEEEGCLAGADPSRASHRAIQRGMPQLGSLGAGNHFLEIQVVEEIYDQNAAEVMELEAGQVTVMIHTGSRGLGYQICDDYVKNLVSALSKYHIDVPDRQLACAPIESKEGQNYLAGMACAANYAWSNRQFIVHWVRESFEQVLGESAEKLGLRQVYDVAHNIAKFEEHLVDGKPRSLCVHRKGATRAFPAGNPKVPEKYRSIGQPVLIPGDMGTNSYVLVGTDVAMKESFGSTCHGAGRVMSRKGAIRLTSGRHVESEMREKGIYVRAKSVTTLREEVSDAYKDVDKVVDVVHRAGLSTRVAKMRPLAVIKG